MAANGAAIEILGERILRQRRLVERERLLELPPLLERPAAILRKAQETLMQTLAGAGPPRRDDVLAEQRAGIVIDRAVLERERVDPHARGIEADATAVQPQRVVAAEQLA